MQSSKPSKKARKIAEETVATPETGTLTTESSSKLKSRASKSSSAKKETSDTGRAKHRPASAEPTVPTRAADSPVIDPVGVMTPSPEARAVTHEHISKLAYSYWIARDYAHGFAEEDWHRAERELKEKR